jgi:four helix bundle protein
MAKLALEDVRVYAQAEELADVIWRVVQRWDRFAKSTVGGQIVRAADSVGANIAEGFGRASPVDHQRFVRTARGSLYEVRHFLRRADKRGLLEADERTKLRRNLHELIPSLNAYLRSIAAHVREK